MYQAPWQGFVTIGSCAPKTQAEVDTLLQPSSLQAAQLTLIWMQGQRGARLRKQPFFFFTAKTAKQTCVLGDFVAPALHPSVPPARFPRSQSWFLINMVCLCDAVLCVCRPEDRYCLAVRAVMVFAIKRISAEDKDRSVKLVFPRSVISVPAERSPATTWSR